MTVHGRTRDQLYGGVANWKAIALARSSVRIPVVANGDIRCPDDLVRCEQVTGCQRFMIGRGALARPELFQVLSGQQATFWPPWRRLALLAKYGARCTALGIPEVSVVGRVKGWWRYMIEADSMIEQAFTNAKRHTTWAELEKALIRGIDLGRDR